MTWWTTRMQTDFYLSFILAILWSVVGFGVYYFLSMGRAATMENAEGGGERNLPNEFRISPGNQIRKIIVQRILGFIFLGLGSVLLILFLEGRSLNDFGLGFAFDQPPPWWFYVAIPLVLVVGFFSSRSESNLSMYPQIRVEIWTPTLLFLSGVSWVVFLVAYEFLFRGFLLYATLSVLDPVPAIALNCSLYAFAHFYKGPAETFGAIPVGIFVCYLTILTGNIWSAVFIHSVMALSNEWFSIRAHPYMKIKSPVG